MINMGVLMIPNKDMVELGSQTAKNGFKNERDICDKFNSWQTDTEARKWLNIMGYNIDDIEYVNAVVLHGQKSDVNVQVKIKIKQSVDIENIQVKLVSNSAGFNQIDKRWLSRYQEMWNIPESVYDLLMLYTGEKKPNKQQNTRDSRRVFMDEFSAQNQQKIIDWFTKNKTLVVSDIIKGRGQFSVEWVLVAQKSGKNARWVLVNINRVLQYFSDGDVRISPRGSLYIGKITMQRKGGDGGRESANMLQFKVNPIGLFDI